jgi:hypothetical protein
LRSPGLLNGRGYRLLKEILFLSYATGVFFSPDKEKQEKDYNDEEKDKESSASTTTATTTESHFHAPFLV